MSKTTPDRSYHVNTAHVVNFLLEANIEDPNVQAFFDRLMLRLFESPALLASFVNASVFKDGQDAVVQLEFTHVPRDLHTEMLNGPSDQAGDGRTNAKVQQWGQ